MTQPNETGLILIITKMKIPRKKIGLAAVAVVCGILVCAVLAVVSQRTLPPVVYGPMLATSQVTVPFLVSLQTYPQPRLHPAKSSNLQPGFNIRAPYVMRPPSVFWIDDALPLPGGHPSHGLELIDTRASGIGPTTPD